MRTSSPLQYRTFSLSHDDSKNSQVEKKKKETSDPSRTTTEITSAEGLNGKWKMWHANNLNDPIQQLKSKHSLNAQRFSKIRFVELHMMQKQDVYIHLLICSSQDWLPTANYSNHLKAG